MSNTKKIRVNLKDEHRISKIDRVTAILASQIHGIVGATSSVIYVVTLTL